MSRAQRTIRVLVVSEPGTSLPVSLETAGPFETTTITSLDEAQHLIDGNRFDFVMMTTHRLRQLRSSGWLAMRRELLETANQGVGIVDARGELVWANPMLMNFPEDVQGYVKRACGQTFSWAASYPAGDRAGHLSGRRLTYETEDGGLYELTATPIIDIDHQVTQVVAVVWDVTRARQREQQLAAIDQAGRELVKLDAEQVSRLDMQERLGLLEQKIIRYLHELMHFDNFTIHILDKKTNKLELVLASGLPQSVQDIDLFALPEGNGITGNVAYYGRSYICPDVSRDARYFSGLEDARSSLTVPLRLNEDVIGVLNVESREVAAFDEESRELAERFGRDIAAALHILDLLVTERYTTTGRLGSDVMAEITGPVNDILTDVESLIEDYIGHDDLRHRLNKIASNSVSIRESIRRVTSPKRGLIGHRPTTSQRSDPILTGKKLLIADDEAMIRETVRDVLASYGCEVITAENGEQAVARVKGEAFDLVLSDIKMPGCTGYEVFAATKDADGGTPVILMTGFGYDPNHSIVRARREGLAAVLFKPFKVDQLLGEIRAALRAPAGE